MCYERDGPKSEPLRCFIKDEGGPFGVGLQEQASNHHKLRELLMGASNNACYASILDGEFGKWSRFSGWTTVSAGNI
ncbi:hypothetical protein [Burkholderia ubonensis]|uniref:hypothetical protein n=1 Tax=Burkholderia ubonensis TaxID=101571 RepID=UPI0012F91962|nr:hypothetical protein [Burkholderia ubonensis]